MKSRILNVSPRAYLRDLDSVNVLPPIIRTGYQKELGYEQSTPFDDGKTIINEEQVMLAPYMVTSSFASFLTGTLYITASYKNKNAYLSKPVINDSIVPFNESFNSSPFKIGTEYNTGFPGEIYPGFTSSIESKALVKINITPTNDYKLTRISRADSLADTLGDFYDTPRTGFIYYNFANQQWDDIGLNDPITGVELDYSTSNLTSSDGLIVDGNKTIMTQFCSSPHLAYMPAGGPTDRTGGEMNSIGDMQTYGYNLIGRPTSFFEAPYAPRYHANKDQAIKLSSYIQHPIACEKVTINLPVIYQRIQNPSAGAADVSFKRDISPFTLFLYLQRRTGATIDSKNDVSSSVRYLIGSTTFGHYNNQTFRSNQPRIGLTKFFEANELNLSSVPINQTQATTLGQRYENRLETTVNVTFRPQIYDQFYGTLSRLSAWNDTLGDTDSVMIRNFWRGGQYASGSTNQIQSWSSTNSTQNRMIGYSTGSQEQSKFSLIPGRGLVGAFWNTLPDVTQSNDSAFSPSPCTLATAYSRLQLPYIETPVLLLPDDELIIGIDAGTYPILNGNITAGTRGYDSSVLDVTGSALTLLAAPSSISLYGSMIQDGHELLPMLNQHLGSDAVSEDIHFNNVVTDQYDTLPRASLSGSFVDRIITRLTSSLTPGEGLLGTATGSYVSFNRFTPYNYARFKNSFWNGALQKNVRLFEDDVVYYDTMTPDPAAVASSFISASVFTPTGSQGATYIDLETSQIVPIKQSTILFDDVIGSAGYSFQNLRSTTNAFLKRAFTYETSTPATLRYRNIDTAFIIIGGLTLIAGASDDLSRILLYYNSYEHPLTAAGTLFFGKNYLYRAASLRYGYMNPRLVGPSYVFRRDRYGHVRDMLEQSRSGKVHYYNEIGSPQVSRSPVVATFVSSSTDQVIDASQTQCSNLSIECTSSVPFFDGYTPRNRSASLPAYSVKFGVNNLIFGVTGSVRFQ